MVESTAICNSSFTGLEAVSSVNLLYKAPLIASLRTPMIGAIRNSANKGLRAFLTC